MEVRERKRMEKSAFCRQSWLILSFFFFFFFQAGGDARHEFILTPNAEGEEIMQFYIEMACNGMFGAGSGLIGPPDPNRFFHLSAVVKKEKKKKLYIQHIHKWQYCMVLGFGCT